MKTLYLLRHGHAPWPPGASDDFHRALDTTGEREAASVGQELARAAVRPELIIASPAGRTRETARIVAAALAYPGKRIRLAPEIYTADVWLLARLVQESPDNLNSLLLIGHNPVLPLFGEWLTGEHLGHLPTCGLLAIGFDGGWEKIGRGMGKLLR